MMKNIRIIDFIPFGEENARTAKELARITGLTERQVRRKISEERQEKPILNFQNRRGYFQPNEDESNLTVRWLMQEKHRNEEHRMSLRGAQAALYFEGIA